MRIPTIVIDIVLVITPYLLGFTELKLTGNSIILDAIDKLSFGEKSILAIVTFMLIEIIDYKFSYSDFVKNTQDALEKTNLELNFIKNKIESLQNKVELINHGSYLDKSLNNIKHPYFVKLISKRLKNLLSKNNSLFEQTAHVSPSHADTFGANGIKSTKEELKCVSFIPEYWEDKKDTEYMETQDGLIKRGVKIKRLFIVNDQNRDNSFEQMRIQNAMGIETKFIEQSMVEADFREKDFLIQDDAVLVELYFDDETQEGKHGNAKELVTIDEIQLLDRKEEFSTNWDCAKKI